jgi:DNA-binding NarL/FixJ family response regulator
MPGGPPILSAPTRVGGHPGAGPGPPPRRPADRLTDRERDALGLIAEGHSNRAIAERLGITTKTLEGMSSTSFTKLGLEDDPDVNRRVLAVLLYLDGAGE